MSEWVVEWLWAGAVWLAASLIFGLVAGKFIRVGSGEEPPK